MANIRLIKLGPRADIHKPHDDIIHLAAVETCDGTKGSADQKGNRNGHNAYA